MPVETQNKYKLVGPLTGNAIHPQTAENAIDFVRSASSSQEVIDSLAPVEIPLTPEQQRQFESVTDSVGHYFYETLGIDTSEYAGSSSNFHILPDDEFNALRQSLNLDGEHTEGLKILGFPIGNDIILREWPDQSDLMHVAQHEYLHLMSTRSIRLTQAGETSMSIDTPRSGVMVNKNYSFGQLAEFIIEQTNIEIVDTVWPQMPDLAMLRPSVEGHGNMVAYGNALVARLAAHQNISTEDALHGLQRAEFMGDYRALRDISDMFGNTAEGRAEMRRLTHLVPAELARSAINQASQRGS